MALIMEVREDERGHWTCSVGGVRFDAHGSRGLALEHMLADAAHSPEAEVWVHFGDGTSEQVPAGLQRFGS